METEFKLIKERVLEEGRIKELLEHMECEHVLLKGNRYEGRLPARFNKSSDRAVQVYLNENLSSRIRNMGFSEGDIFGLVAFIVYDCYSDAEQKKSLNKAKRYICNKLGYTEYIGNSSTYQPVEDPLKWLKDIRKQRNRKELREFAENRVYDESILNQYVMYPYLAYIEEGIDYETQLEFQVGFDVQSERIIWPIHNQWGDIISVKGRTIDPLYKEKGIYKFLYLYNYNKMIEFYNWHRSLYYVYEKKEIIIFEAEKSCWLATQFGHRNCVAIGGDDISDYQVAMIKNLGLEFKIIIAFDKDKTADDFKRQAKKFGNSRQVYALWDAQNLLSKESKDSPTDNGREVFEQLLSQCYKYRIIA